MRTLTPKSQHFTFILISTLLLAELLVSFQGFDLCDEGWVLSAYQQLFHNPAGAQYQFLYFNSLVTGALWNELFGSFGIAGFRLLDSLFIIAIGILVFNMLKKHVNNWIILTGLLLCIFMRDWGSMVFNHNSITALLSVLSASFLYGHVQNRSLSWLFLAFLVIGINIFSRIPNATMLVLGILVPIDFFYHRNSKLLLKQIAIAAAGCICGIAIILTSMKLSGTFQYFMLALEDLRSAGRDPESTHQLPMMLASYISTYFSMTKQIIAELFIVGLYFLATKKLKSRATQILLAIITIALLWGTLIYWKSAISWSYSVISSMLLIAIYYYRKDRELLMLSVIALCIAHFLPLGSDFGIGNMGYVSLWISWPLALGIAFRMISDAVDRPVWSARLVLSGVIALFAIRQATTIAQTAYFDHGSRLAKQYKIKNPLATTYTTREKALVMNELLRNLSFHVKKDDYLLCFQSLPMLNYLTETRPYLGNSWVWTYDPSLMSEKFELARATINEMPVIVREKCQPLSGKWTTPLATYNREDLPTDYEYKASKIKIINKFIRENQYTVAWENTLFQILTPARNSSALADNNTSRSRDQLKVN